MHVSKILRKLMYPFLEEHGFHLHQHEGTVHIFRHQTEEKLCIIIETQPASKRIHMELAKGTGGLPYYNLSLFTGYPEFPDTSILGSEWCYDTDEDVVGLLEEQANILLKRGFDWMYGRSDVDLDQMVVEKAGERERISKTGSAKEKEESLRRIRETKNRWRKLRFKPREWRLPERNNSTPVE